MQASMREVVLPLDGRDDEVHHSTEMDQIGSSCRDESQLSSQIDDETLEDADILIDHTLVQYFGEIPSVSQNELQPSPPPPVTRDDVPAEQGLPKTSEPKRFSVDSVEPNLASIDRYGSTIDSNWDETETDFNYYLPNYAQEVVITTETNSPQASDKEPSERLVTAPHDYSLDVIVPEKLGVQGFPFEEALNPLTSTTNPNQLQEESAFFDEMDLNPAGLKDCKSFYEAQTNVLSAEGSPETVSPGCGSMHIVPMSDGMLEVATQSPPEEVVGSVGLGDVGKNVIVEMNPVASPDVARVPCANPVCQPMSPPPSYRQTMAAAYQKTVYDPLSCCGPYGNVVKNKIVLSYSGEGVMSENDSRDSDFGPPKLDAIDDNHSSTNDHPNDYPPMLEPADPGFSNSSKVAGHVIPSAAGEALESVKKLSLGVVPENGQELIEGSSQDELNECLGKLVPSITPEFSKEIPSGYIVNDVYNIRNITPESSTIAACVDDVGSLPDLLPVTEEPKLYRTFSRAYNRKKKAESTETFASSTSLRKSIEKVVSRLPEPPNKFDGSYNLHVSSAKVSVQNASTVQPSCVNVVKKDPSTSTSPIEKIGPITRVVKVAKTIPQQVLMQDDGTGRANFKIIPTTSTTINLGVKKLTIVKPQNMKDRVVLLKPANVKKILASDLESVSNLKQLSCVQSRNLEKLFLSQASLDPKCGNLPTSSKAPSNSVILKLPKDDSNPSTVKGMPKVAVGKGAVALKVSLPLESLPPDILPVKRSHIPDASKSTAVVNKVDEPIEKAVTAEGDVDPNAIMDAMKVSVPYLFPVTKPEVKKIVKPDVGKVEQPNNLVQLKKKSAAAPVVVKMTSKANRRSFSPIRDVEATLEKSESVIPSKHNNSLVKKVDAPNIKPELKGDSENPRLPLPLSTNDVIIKTVNKLSTNKNNDTVDAKVGTVIEIEQPKEKIDHSILNDSKKKFLEPSLMKPVDNASDDLSSFLSSLSGPQERPKSVENLEKVVHESIVAASACVVGVDPVTPRKTGPVEDPIIIPPCAFRNDDPLSLKIGLQPCKFRHLKSVEPSKKPQISQSARSALTSSRSTVLPTSKPPLVVQKEPLISKKSTVPQTNALSTTDKQIPPLEEFERKEDSQIETEEKLHPIIELVNQLIESNSKSPQIFSEPDKTRSEDGILGKKGESANKVEKVHETVVTKAFASLKNDSIRAKEDGILAGVVKERTSKLIQKARELLPDVHVRSDDNCSSLTVEESVDQVKTSVVEKTSDQKQSEENSVPPVESSVSEKDEQTNVIEGSMENPSFLLKTSPPGKVLEQSKAMSLDDKPNIILPAKTIDAPFDSSVASIGMEAQNLQVRKSYATTVSPEKNSPSEVQGTTPNEVSSDQQNLTLVSHSEETIFEKRENGQADDVRVKCSPKSASPLTPASPLAVKSFKPQKHSEINSTTCLQATDEAVTEGKTAERPEGNEAKELESSQKTNDLLKKDSASSDEPAKPKKVASVEEPLANQPPTTIDIRSGKKLEQLKLTSNKELKKSSRQQVAPDGLAVEPSEGLKVEKFEDSKPSLKTTELSEKPSSNSVNSDKQSNELLTQKPTTNRLSKKCTTSTDKLEKQSKELLNEKPVFNQLQTAGASVSACKTSDDVIKGKKAKDVKVPLNTDTLKKVPSGTAIFNSKLELTAVEVIGNKSTTKSNSCVPSEAASREIKGKQEVAIKHSVKSTVSSKTAASGSEKPPTQLIVSIPNVAISNQPHSSNIVFSFGGTLGELKVEKGKSVKSLPTTNSSKKAPSSKAEPLKQKTPSEAEANSESATTLSVGKTSEESNGEQTPVDESPTNLSEKISNVKDALPKQQTPPSLDRRTSTRRKSKSELSVVSAGELNGEDVRDAQGPAEKVGPVKTHTPRADKTTDKLMGSNSIGKTNTSSKHDTSSSLFLLSNARGKEATDTQETAESVVIPENGHPSLEKSVRLPKMSEKISHRMQTRGSAPDSASLLKDEVKVESAKETAKITRDVQSVENDSSVTDSNIKKPAKIPMNDKSTNRRRTRSETSTDKKVHAEESTENLEPVAPVAVDKLDLPTDKGPGKKSRVESNSAFQPSTELVPSSPRVPSQKQDINDTPILNLRTRGKIERKPATVKPIPATPKKGCSKVLGNLKTSETSLDDFDDLDDFPTPFSKNVGSEEPSNVSENDSDTQGGRDDKICLRTPVSTRRSSSLKNNALTSSEIDYNIDDIGQSVPSIRKSTPRRATVCRNPKKLTPKRNLRVASKPKKVGKLFKKDLKNHANDVYDFTDDEDQSTKIQTIDHYRMVSGKAAKNKKNSFSRFEASQESLLLSDDENKTNNQARISRNESKVVPSKTKRRASPRKSLSEPRKSESKKGTDSQFKNLTSESTESLLSNSNETVLPAELQENLRNSRNESMRLAKQNRLKKSPSKKVSSADKEEAMSPKPSSTRETRRSSGSRTSSVENVIVADHNDKKELEKVVSFGNRPAVAKEEGKPTIETTIRESRRSSGSSSTCGDKFIADEKEIFKVVSSDRLRKRSPLKKDANNASDKMNSDKISVVCKGLKSKESVGVNSSIEGTSRPSGDCVSHISTRSKSRDSINEDDTSLTRALRNKGVSQPNPIVSCEPKLTKSVEEKSAKGSEEIHKSRNKIDKTVRDNQVPDRQNLDKLQHEHDTNKSSSTKEACETLIDLSSPNRIITRSSGVPSFKNPENEVTENAVPKATSDGSLLLPKLRSSASKRLDGIGKTDHEAIEVHSASKSPVLTSEQLNEILPTNVDSIHRVSPDKLKKIKKSDSVVFAGSKEVRFPVDRIHEDVSKPIIIATGDASGKGKPKRVKKGGVADGVNDILLNQSPLIPTQDITSRNAEAVSLKTPPMDSTATQEPDNIQPVGAMSQHGEPEGAKSTTRVAQLRSLVAPLDEGICASNSIGFLRKKNKKVVLEKKKLVQAPSISDVKPVDGEVITRKANDTIIKSGSKRSSMNCLEPPVKFERHRTHVNNEVVSKSSLSLGKSPSCELKNEETICKNTGDVLPNHDIKLTRRITRSSLSTSPNLDSKNLKSGSNGEQENVALENNYLNSSSSDLSQGETEPCSSKDKKNTFSKEGLKPITSHYTPPDPVKESLLPSSDLKSSLDSGEHTSQIPVDSVLPKNILGSSKVETPRNELEATKTSRSKRGRKPKAALTSERPLEKDEMKLAEPQSLNSEKEKGALTNLATLGPPSGEYLPSLGRNMTQGKSKTLTKKDPLSKPSSYCMIPNVNVGRVKTTTKDVCEISGEAEKLFEEASLDGKEGFDVIVPSPGKSPDSTTQNSSEIIIPVLSSELEILADAKLSEDAHGVTSTTELGDVLSNTERKMLILPPGFNAINSPTKKEDESVSSTTDSSKTVETNEVESSSDHVISLKEDTLLPKPVAVENERSSMNILKTVVKLPKFSGEPVTPEHPKKIWRVNPILNVSSTPSEPAAKIMIGSLEDEVSNVVKPISEEELKRTPLKKRQVWVYKCCISNDDVKKLVCTGSGSPVEGDSSGIHSTNDASPSSESPKSSTALVQSSNACVTEDVLSTQKKSSESLCTGKADGTCSPTSVDRLPHSICNILAAPTDKLVTNEPSVEPPSEATESSEPGVNKPNRDKFTHSTRSKSKEANMVKRKVNKKFRSVLSLRSSKSRVTQKRRLMSRRNRIKRVRKRHKITRKRNAVCEKIKLPPSPKLLPPEKSMETEDVNWIKSCAGQLNEVNEAQKIAISEEVHSNEDNKIVDSNSNPGPDKNPPAISDKDSPVIPPSEQKPIKVLDSAKQPGKVPSPPSKGKYAELNVDTTDKEIDDEESPPFSPIGVDTTKPSDWNSHSSSAVVEPSVIVERNSPTQTPCSFTQGFPGTPDIPPEDVAYRRSQKIERIRSYSNVEPDRSHILGSKARSRRKSHPIENIPVDLSNRMKPVFGMKIPPNLPKLDLTGRSPIYHEALEQPPVPYDLIPTTLVRPIPTPPPNYVHPNRPLIVHSIQGNAPIRPIPTLQVASPVAPYVPMTSQFSPPEEMSLELSSRMNATYSLSAFHSTKKKPANPNYNGPKKIDYNPLLFAHGNNYIQNAGMSNVMPSLPSTSAYMNSPSSLMKPLKSRSARGRLDSTAPNANASASKSRIGLVKSALPDSTETTARDLRLHEAQVHLLMSNPELSVSRPTASDNGRLLTSGTSGGSLRVKNLDLKKSNTYALNPPASSGCCVSQPKRNIRQEDQRAEVEIIEPLDVVTCELDEGSPDSSVDVSRKKVFGVRNALEQQTSKDLLVPKAIWNEPKNSDVSAYPAQVVDAGRVTAKSVQEAVVVVIQGVASTNGSPEKPLAKAVSTPRRRISILDVHKSYKKNSSTEVVAICSPTEKTKIQDKDTNSTPPAIILSEPKVPASKTIKTIEKNCVPTKSKCSETSKLNTIVITTMSKERVSPLKDIFSSHNVALASLGTALNGAKAVGDRKQSEPASDVNPGGEVPVSGPSRPNEEKGPFLATDDASISNSKPTSEISLKTFYKENKVSESLTPQLVHPAKPNSTDETAVKADSASNKPTIADSHKPDLNGPKISKNVVEETRGQEKIAPPSVQQQGNSEKPMSVITNKLVSLNRSDSITASKTSKLKNAQSKTKTSKVPEPSSELNTGGKLNIAVDKLRAVLFEKPFPDPKTDEISRPKRITDAKMSEQSTEVVGKSISEQKCSPNVETDAHPTFAHATLETGQKAKSITESTACKKQVAEKSLSEPKTDEISNPKPIADAKMSELSTEVGGKSISEQKCSPNVETDAHSTFAHATLETGQRAKSITESTACKKQVAEKSISEPKTDEISNPKPMTDVKVSEQRTERVEKSISEEKTDAPSTVALATLKTGHIAKSVPESATGKKQVIGKSISEPKIDAKSNRPQVIKSVSEFKPDDKFDKASVKPRANVVEKPSKPKTEDKLTGANIQTEPIKATTKSKVETCPTTSNILEKDVAELKTDDSLTIASSDDKLETTLIDLGAVEVKLDEQKTVDQPKSLAVGDLVTLGCSDKPIRERSSELTEEQKTAEKASPTTVSTEANIKEVADTLKNFGNKQGPLNYHLVPKLPRISDDNLNNSSAIIPPPKPCPSVPTALPPSSSTSVGEKIETKAENSPIEVKKPVLLDGMKTAKTSSPTQDNSNESPTVSIPNTAHCITENIADSSKAKEKSKPAVGNHVSAIENLEKSSSPTVKIADEHDDPPAAKSAKKTEEARNTVEPIKGKNILDNILTNPATCVLPEDMNVAKNIASAAAEHVEQNNEGKKVSDLATVHRKVDSVGVKPLKQPAEACKPVNSENLKPIEKENLETISGERASTLVVSPAASKSVGSPSDKENTKSQDSEVKDFPSEEPLSTGKLDDVSTHETPSCNKVTQSGSNLDSLSVQDDSSEMNNKVVNGTGNITSNLNNGETSSTPELLVVPPDENGNSTVNPDPSSSQSGSLNAPNDGPSYSEAKTPSQANSPSCTRIESCEVERVAGTPNIYSGSPNNNISSLVLLSERDPVVTDQSNEPLSASHFPRISVKETLSNSFCKQDHPKPSHSDHQAADTDPTISRETKSVEECDTAEIHESSSQSLVVNTEETVPSPPSETSAIVQSPESSLLLPSDSTKDINVKDSISECEYRSSASSGILTTRPERKRKRPTWWLSEQGGVASKSHKHNAATSSETPYEVDYPGEYGEKIKIDPSVPKVEVELLCQSVIRKLQENLGITIDQVDMTKLTKYWTEFHSSFSGDLTVGRARDVRSNQPKETAVKSPTVLDASDIYPRPSTSRSSDYIATIHSPASRSAMEKQFNAQSKSLTAILHERNKLAKQPHFEALTKRGAKRTVSQAFAQNVFIYKDPRVTGRSTYERKSGIQKSQQLPFELPEVAGTPPNRQRPQMSYSWILEQLRERRKKLQFRERNIPVPPCKDFIRPREEYTRPSLKEVYNNIAEGHPASMVGFSRVTAAVREVPAGTSSSTTSRVPTFTISSDSEDSNPGNSEDTVSERDEVRRRIRRKSNTPSISSCSCPQPGHVSNRTNCPSCRKERYHGPGAYSPIRSSRPPLYTEISHVERQECARVRGKHAATVGGGDDPIAVPDSEAAVHLIKRMLANTLNDEPPVSRDSFTSYHEGASSPHVTVSPCHPPLSSSSAHPPPNTERVAGATFQRCLQQKPFSERGQSEDNCNDNVQHGSVISTVRQMLSLLSQPGTSTGPPSAAFPAMVDIMEAAGSRLGMNSGVDADLSVRSHDHNCTRPSSSTTTDVRDPLKRKPSEATQQLLSKFWNILENVTPEVSDEIAELFQQSPDAPDGPPTKKKKS